MKHYNVSFIFTTIIITLISLDSFAQDQLSNQSNNILKSVAEYNNIRIANSYNSTALDAYILARMEQYHFPGLSACIIKDDQIIWKGNYGYANIEQKILVTDSTLFYIASVSKTFTGTAVMQLWEQGLFELNDDVNDYLPFNVRNPNHPKVPITFRMLLTHTSGIHFVGGLITWGSDSPVELGYYIENYLTPNGVYYQSNNWNTWVPGTQHDYSNVSVALLGYLVEKITNIPFEKYCQDSIFVPLGMTETSWFLDNLDEKKIATPYEYSGGRYSPNPHWGIAEYPSAQIRTGLTQLASFINAYMQGGQIDGKRILNSSTIDSMTTIHNPAIHPSQGLIWFIPELGIPDIGDRIICMHIGGWISGANSLAAYILETGEKVGVIILTNRRYDDGIIEIGLELLSYGIITDIEKEIANFPKDFFLNQNYPNPFNTTTTISYQLPSFSYVNLSIYNILGEKVATLISVKQPVGTYKVEWDASGLASGIYFYSLETDKGFIQSRKLILLK